MQERCQNCGYIQQPGMTSCPQCGTQFSTNPFGQVKQVKETETEWAWVIASFFVSTLGLILWIVWKEDKPKTAKACGIAALINAGIGIAILSIVAMIYT